MLPIISIDKIYILPKMGTYLKMLGISRKKEWLHHKEKIASLDFILIAVV